MCVKKDLESDIQTKILDIELKLISSDQDKRHGGQTYFNSKCTVITETEIAKLLSTYVKSENKKYFCTVCNIKFRTKCKALTHVENKHVDCFLYKCPLCKVTKVTRLAYECHIRRGHVARVKDYSPQIRIIKTFSVKSEAQTSLPVAQSGQSYDLEFVTFLRNVLKLRQKVDTLQRAITCAEWIEQDQGIFRINNRQEFAMGWYCFKVTVDNFLFHI
jgi:hypothetical protein